MEINQKILHALAKFKATAIGFVNEEKLYKGNEEIEKSAILKLWVDHKQPLGNHTYSHKFLSSTDAKDFQNDVIKGAAVSKKLMNDAGLKYQYFRHPYLDTGTTFEMRKNFEYFLQKEGYIVAPFTIDTDYWKFNQQLLENPNDKDNIIAKYLDHTRTKFAFYKEASLKIFGRNIKHIWLLHVNLLNAYAMEDLLKLAKELGYEFITLDKALKDEVYAEPDNYYAPFGVSWLYRWDFTRGKVVDWSKDPEPEQPIYTHRNPNFY
jgi:peptidoglycan/xylan/chitin deacetylase (PgdA/CDA1 family)